MVTKSLFILASTCAIGGAFSPRSFPPTGGTKLHSSPSTTGSTCQARDLIKSLIENEKCFCTESGARAFGEACDVNVVFEDCCEPEPIVGRADVTNHMLRKAERRKNGGDVRIDRITDGNKACGYAWTWVSDSEEGLRGTTFVELNDDGQIQYVREIPEPLYKPGDLTVELLSAVTKGAEAKAPPVFEKRTPTLASEVAKYLYCEVQGGDVEEVMRLFDDSIVYRDFNYEEPLISKAEVREFIEKFSFPGITFRPQKFDDGEQSTCFTWAVELEGVEDTVKGMSLYELDPESRKISYVRDVPESAIKPPPLGNLAKTIRPQLGVFKGVPIGSRPGGK